MITPIHHIRIIFFSKVWMLHHVVKKNRSQMNSLQWALINKTSLPWNKGPIYKLYNHVMKLSNLFLNRSLKWTLRGKIVVISILVLLIILLQLSFIDSNEDDAEEIDSLNSRKNLEYWSHLVRNRKTGIPIAQPGKSYYICW